MNAELKNITYSKFFLLLSSLAKNLLGTFNCIYLYKHGFSVIEVAIWVLITYIGYMFFQPILLKYSYLIFIVEYRIKNKKRIPR